ncbi:MAG: hypothetical protein IAE80_05655 [Anaerolinea sp.]|nr:hypothetical protein [Anaerolinea sp.]
MDTLTQHEWTEDELRAAGFRYYRRKKTVILARELPPEEAPKVIHVDYDTLVAAAGYIICYDPDSPVPQPTLDDYPQHPVEPHTFHATYRAWDETWTPTPAERHLLASGCAPYYKVAGVWAKQVSAPTELQSWESVQPILVPPGAWVVIGGSGEPYSMSGADFWQRYEPT